jgi:ABC-type glycerol-3-phosphate transport system substrate-binding protein
MLVTSGFGCKLISSDVKNAMKPVVLNFWSVYDDEDALKELISSYSALHPYVSIKFRKLRLDEYESQLIEGFAKDRGPDIFSIHNTWVRGYSDLIKPLPDSYKMVFPEIKGSIKKEIVPTMRTMKGLTLRELGEKYLDVVYKDVVLNDEKKQQRIFALPLYSDSLVMFYNKDLLNNANIATPPLYWNTEFQKMVKKLTRQDANGAIVQSAIALGGSGNIERYSDILSVLMMQNGAEMVNENGYVSFHAIPPIKYYQEKRYNPGMKALEFYADFSNPLKEVYCWNKDMKNSLELFAEGRLAFFLGYSYHIPQIKALGPKVNFGIAKLPQIENSAKQVNFTNYWVETVASKSKHPDEAWDFIQFASNAENASKYLKTAKRPTALKELVDTQKNDEELGVFAEELLTSDSWYRGYDSGAAEKIVGQMIDEAVKGDAKLDAVIGLAAERVQQTFKKPENK